MFLIFHNNVLVKKHKIQMCYKKKKPLLCDVMKNSPFFRTSGHFQYYYRLLFIREIRKIRSWKEISLKSYSF